jgi:acetyl esterase/lipase
VKTYRYGSHERQQLDVLAAARSTGSAKGPRPAVVLVHGGGWIKGDKSKMHAAARDLVGEGYVAIPVNYRLAQHAAWPAQREDVQQAIRWVQENADLIDVDTSRIVVLGSSAGAEIAAAALTEGDGSRYARGLVALSGPMDLALVVAGAGGLATVVTDQLLRCDPDDCAEKLKTSSAISRLDSRDPASLVIASRDEWVDPRSSYRFHERARKTGVPSDLHVLSGRQHGMDYWDRAWPVIRDWIAQRMAARV